MAPVEDLHAKRFAALKVMVANVSRHTSYDIDVLRHLGRQQQDASALSSSAEYVMGVFDYFEIEGPNGNHCCIVAELLSPVLSSLEPADIRLPLDIGRTIAAQVARGVAYLHRCGIAHGGMFPVDIMNQTYSRPSSWKHPSMPEMERWSFEEVQRYFGKPVIAPVQRTDGNPIERSEHLPQYLVSCPLSLPILLHSPGSVWTTRSTPTGSYRASRYGKHAAFLEFELELDRQKSPHKQTGLRI
jgi:serine/threonine-protein kinase SRPK3